MATNPTQLATSRSGQSGDTSNLQRFVALDNAATMKKNYADKTRREQATRHLEAARDAEAQGLAILEQIVAK